MLGSRLELALGVSERPSWVALGCVQTGAGAGVGDGARVESKLGLNCFCRRSLGLA